MMAKIIQPRLRPGLGGGAVMMGGGGDTGGGAPGEENELSMAMENSA